MMPSRQTGARGVRSRACLLFTQRSSVLETHTHPGPELIVVADVVGVVEEEPAFADEVRLVRRMAERYAEVHHSRRRKGVASGQVPEGDPDADERVARHV